MHILLLQIIIARVTSSVNDAIKLDTMSLGTLKPRLLDQRCLDQEELVLIRPECQPVAAPTNETGSVATDA